jgi:hypothetical protein
VVKLYAERLPTAIRQLLTDIVVVIWVYLWIRAGLWVNDMVEKLGVPGAKLESAGGGIADNLTDAGEIDVMRPPGGEHLYRRCSKSHHHHLVCRACGRAVEVEGPAVESWADKVASQNGFVDVSHTVEIFGTCPECAAKR